MMQDRYRAVEGCANVVVLLLSLVQLAIPGVDGDAVDYGVPSVVVQLSDIHISCYQGESWYSYGKVVEDLRLFGETVLDAIGPDTVLITGDLTDGKSLLGGGQQNEEEWMAYDGVVKEFVSRTAPVLDILGNHDKFNVFDECCEHYRNYSYCGREKKESPKGRTAVHVLVNQELVTFDTWRDKFMYDGSSGCPKAVLFGLDASASLGLKSPTNFVGLVNSKDVEEATLVGEQVKALLNIVGCGPTKTPIISYGHFPLSTISSMRHPEGRWYNMGIFGALGHALDSIYCMQGVGMAHVIAEVATVYVSGHLHSAFGEKLHRVHTIEKSQRYLTELETAAWKDDRRFRIITVDSGCLSFGDFYFNTPSSPRIRAAMSDSYQRRIKSWQTFFDSNAWGVTSATDEASGATVIDSIPIITWPRDARYSLCEDIESLPRGMIRVMVFSMHPNLHVEEVNAEVYADGQSNASKPLWRFPLDRVDISGESKSRKMIFQKTGNIMVADESLRSLPRVSLQIEVRGKNDKGIYVSSVSDTRTARLECSLGGCTVESYDGRAALELTLREQITLAVNWPNLAHRMYFIAFAGLMLMLILPKMLIEKHSEAIIAYYRRVLSSPWYYPSRYMAPFISLCILPLFSTVWYTIIGYCMYLITGPLYLADLLSGNLPFVVFHHGVIGYIQGDVISVPTPDVLLVQVMHLLCCIFPMTVFLGRVAGRRYIESSSSSSTQETVCLTSYEIALVLCIVAVNVRVVYIKAIKLMGYISLLLSPGFAWTIPLAVLLCFKRWNIDTTPRIKKK